MKSIVLRMIYRVQLWRLSLRDDPAIKELTKAIPAKRRQHKRIIKNIQSIRHARMRVQQGRV